MYKDILDDVKWSFSRIHQYEQCPYAFYMNKIDGTELDEGNYYSEVGSFIHEINAKVFEGSLNAENALDYFMDNYDDFVTHRTKQSTMDKKYSQSIAYLSELDLSRLDNYEILGVEKSVEFTIDKYKFIGFIDLLLKDKRTGDIVLIDHKSSQPFFGKTGKLLKAQSDNFYSYSKQMYLYAKAIHDEYGKFPSVIAWNHFFDNAITSISFNQEDYDKTIEWAVNTIEKIYNDTEFEANPKYMMCNVLCGYRNSCVYKEDGDNE